LKISALGNEVAGLEYDAGKYDIIVVGAGHAGCEAGLAAARLGCRTLILTLNLDYVALMPCNPAVGGPAKSQLVREVDALGGEMGLNTDYTSIQMRLLNTGKGPAVHALRAQSDKMSYQNRMKQTLEKQQGLDLKQALVDKILVKKGKVCGVVTSTGARFEAGAVILTTGTYLKGRIIIGDLSYPGAPNGQFPSIRLSDSLKDLGIKLDRFKTGTPARVAKSSIDFSRMLIQPGDQKVHNFSFMSGVTSREQIPCWLTYTNEKTHRIILDNLDRAPLYTGAIQSRGPRYCPSIETKVVRFSDKPAHQVFIEPEGKNTDEMYVQGMSTSLPEDVQLAMLRTLPGLERVEMMRPGYAIEYDFVAPAQLKQSLEIKSVPGRVVLPACSGICPAAPAPDEAVPLPVFPGAGGPERLFPLEAIRLEIPAVPWAGVHSGTVQILHVHLYYQVFWILLFVQSGIDPRSWQVVQIVWIFLGNACPEVLQVPGRPNRAPCSSQPWLHGILFWFRTVQPCPFHFFWFLQGQFPLSREQYFHVQCLCPA
jgi:tRNA uridine 5-carboxymethylaminomethyl modification enzyme